MDHSSFTTTVSIHGGRKATKKYKSVVLLDSGSPSSFVMQAVIDEMLRKGAASADIITVGKPRRGVVSPTQRNRCKLIVPHALAYSFLRKKSRRHG